MGCCLGTATTNKSSKTSPNVVPPSNHRRHFPTPEPDFGAPPPVPPPPNQEETVKEVLLETPVPKPPISLANDSNQRRNRQHLVVEEVDIEPTVGIKPPISLANDSRNRQHPVVEEVDIEPTVVIKPPISLANDSSQRRNGQHPVVEEVDIEPKAVIKPAGDVISEISEFSEMCSFSESLSTVTEKRDDDGEVTQLVQRPPTRVPRKRPVPGGKEKGLRSPVRRSEPSPIKKTNVTSRALQGRTMTTTRRNVGPSNAVRRDPGESSGRRSRSPVTRGEARAAGPPARYKSPTLTSTGRSDGRIPPPQSEKGCQGEKPAEQPETNDSLENPLVALECFIFL